jgi:hypothetical protein
LISTGTGTPSISAGRKRNRRAASSAGVAKSNPFAVAVWPVTFTSCTLPSAPMPSTNVTLASTPLSSASAG